MDGRIKKVNKVHDRIGEVASVNASTPLDLTKYNFPPNFKMGVTTANKPNEQAQFLNDCDLKRNPRPGVSPSSTKKDASRGCMVCSVCGHRSTSIPMFNDHHKNNHPGVSCGYYRIEPSVAIPTDLLVWQFSSSQGLLRNSALFPNSGNLSTDSVKCTKCDQYFLRKTELHEHILFCAKQKPIVAQKTTSSTESSGKLKVPKLVVKLTPKASESSTQSTVSSRKRQSVVINAEIMPQPEPIEAKQAEPEQQTEPTKRARLERKPKTLYQDFQLALQQAKQFDTHKDGNNNSARKVKKPSAKYMCKRCKKEFDYASTLKKHQLSCISNTSKAKMKNKLAKSKRSKRKARMKAKAKDGEKDPHIETAIELNDNEPPSDQCIVDPEVLEEELEALDEQSEKLEKAIVFNLKEEAESKESTIDAACDENAEHHTCEKCSKTFSLLENYHKHRTTCSSDEEPNEVEMANSDEEKMDIPEDTKGESPIEELPPENLPTLIKCSEIAAKPDIWKIKEDHPTYAFKGSPAQHHSCPYCQRGFTYLANYRKHIQSICPIRQQLEEKQKKAQQLEEAQQSETQAVSENNSAESESTTSESTTPNTLPEKTTFRSYSCGTCHKIFLSQFQMLRHSLSHKLNEVNGTASADLKAFDASNMDEELAAKQALIKHEMPTRKSLRRLKTVTPEQPTVPIGNLLENLARGGNENDEQDTKEESEEEEEQEKLSNELIEERSVEDDQVNDIETNDIETLEDCVLVLDEAEIEDEQQIETIDNEDVAEEGDDNADNNDCEEIGSEDSHVLITFTNDEDDNISLPTTTVSG